MLTYSSITTRIIAQKVKIRLGRDSKAGNLSMTARSSYFLHTKTPFTWLQARNFTIIYCGIRLSRPFTWIKNITLAKFHNGRQKTVHIVVLSVNVLRILGFSLSNSKIPRQLPADRVLLKKIKKYNF